jgi:hypothetical protein
MSNEVISYQEMCARERASLQRGMNFGLHPGHSVILMSVRANAPYEDRFEDDGSTLIYEGHDHPKTANVPVPKVIDQPRTTPAGTLTQNGKFAQAAELHKRGEREAERVRVYEKIRPGIWSYNGVFHLVDAWLEESNGRKVFKFRLLAVGEEDLAEPSPARHPERRRIIPTHVKLAVWKRDHGKCVMCGAEDDLHFDHVIPYSRGGASMVAENVQLLCARHNLEKRDKIE